MAVTFPNPRVPDPRRVKEIADRLIQAEQDLAKLRAEWGALFVSIQPEEESPKGTLADRIVGLIQGRYEETFTAPMVSQILEANPNSVGPLLSRLVAEGKVRKVGHGEYRGTTPPFPWLTRNEQEKSPEAQGS